MASPGQARGPVDRRIEGYLPEDMGQCDLASLIRPRSTEPIRACGPWPRQQAGHMTANDLQIHTRRKVLASRGPSTHVLMNRGSGGTIEPKTPIKRCDDE